MRGLLEQTWVAGWDRPASCAGGTSQPAAELPPARPRTEGQAKPRESRLRSTAHLCKSSTYSPPLRATALLSPSLLIWCSHLSVLLIKQSIARLLLQCLPLPRVPLARTGERYPEMWTVAANSFGNKMALAPERPNSPSSGIMLHFNLSSIKTQKLISPGGRKINSFLFQHQGKHRLLSQGLNQGT